MSKAQSPKPGEPSAEELLAHLRQLGNKAEMASSTALASPSSAYTVLGTIALEGERLDRVQVLFRSMPGLFGGHSITFMELIIRHNFALGSGLTMGITRTAPKRAFPFFGKIVSFRWTGGRLAPRLNADKELHQRLREFSPDIAKLRLLILPEPNRGCVAVSTVYHLPSRELWDSYNLLAQHIREELMA